MVSEADLHAFHCALISRSAQTAQPSSSKPSSSSGPPPQLKPKPKSRNRTSTSSTSAKRRKVPPHPVAVPIAFPRSASVIHLESEPSHRGIRPAGGSGARSDSSAIPPPSPAPFRDITTPRAGRQPSTDEGYDQLISSSVRRGSEALTDMSETSLIIPSSPGPPSSPLMHITPKASRVLTKPKPKPRSKSKPDREVKEATEKGMKEPKAKKQVKKTGKEGEETDASQAEANNRQAGAQTVNGSHGQAEKPAGEVLTPMGPGDKRKQRESVSGKSGKKRSKAVPSWVVNTPTV